MSFHRGWVKWLDRFEIGNRTSENKMKNHDEIMERIENCEENGEEIPRSRSFGDFISKISVEVTLFLYMMAFMITSVVENAFFVYKSCLVNHQHSHDICINIQNYKDINKEVQKTTSDFLQYNSIAGHVIPIVLALFMGSFSDKRGRWVHMMIMMWRHSPMNKLIKFDWFQ